MHRSTPLASDEFRSAKQEMSNGILELLPEPDRENLADDRLGDSLPPCKGSQCRVAADLGDVCVLTAKSLTTLAKRQQTDNQPLICGVVPAGIPLHTRLI